MKRDNTTRKRFDPLSTGIFGPLPQPAGGPGIETSLEIPWRELWDRAPGRSTWWRYLVPLAILFAMLLSLPSLEAGFYLDDYIMIGLIEGWYGADAPALNLYASFLEVPSAPWWASDAAHASFWRPLSSAMIRLSHLLFGHQAFFYHLHLLLWLAALIAVCGRLYRVLSPRVAAVALLLFAADEAHAFTSGVICNGHVVISVVPALLGLVAYLRWRKEGWRPGLGLALLGFAVGLLGGETAFAVLAYPLAYEMFGARGPRGRRLRAIAPVAALAVSYLLFYKLMGFGPGGSGEFYLDPFHQPPAEFLAGLATRLPFYMASLLGALPLKLLASPALFPVYLAAGVALPVALLWGWRRLRGRLAKPDRRALGWLLPGAFAALLPVALAPPSERQLLVPALGLAPLVASLAVLAWKSWTRSAKRPRVRVAASLALALLVLLHFGVAAWNRIDNIQATARLTRTLEATAASAARLAREQTGSREAAGDPLRHDLVLLASGFMASYYGPLIEDLRQGPEAISWSTLTFAPFAHRVTRSAPRTLLLETVGGRMLTTFPERMFFAPGEELAVGDTAETDLFTAEILAADDHGPTRVAFHFKRDLDDPTLTLLAWRDGRLRRLEAPAAGESLFLEQPPPLWLS